MPTQRRCPHSRALIFDLTPDEVEQKEAAKKVKELEQQVADLQQAVNKLLKKGV